MIQKLLLLSRFLEIYKEKAYNSRKRNQLFLEDLKTQYFDSLVN